MNRTARITTCVLIATLPFAAVAAEDPSISPAATEALDRFLDLDCEVGEPGAALAAVVGHANELEPVLAGILLDGPDAGRLDEVADLRAQQWQRRQAYLDTNPWIGLDAQALASVESMTLEEFVDAERARYDALYRERAVLGLAGIGSPTALSTLRAASQDADETLARLILGQLQRNRPVPRATHTMKAPRALSGPHR
jgi:hypothetical protein